MDDREQLKMAAKAAGIHWNRWDYERLRDLGHMVTPSMMWNPLNNDGDALRLAVNLRIDIDYDELEPRVEAYHKVLGEDSHFCADECMEPDPAAATRRAIVRAAAELGKAMP